MSALDPLNMVDPTDFGAVKVTIDPAEFGAVANVDEEAGAPMGVRTAVGSSTTPEDKLSTLQRYYPDARPWGTDNFLYTDEKTGNNTLFNPKGVDMGDVHSNGRLIAEFIGGSVGGAVAAVGGQLGPQALTPEEVVTVPLAVGVGAEMAGKGYDALSSMFTPYAETRSAASQIGAGANSVMLNAIGVKAGELAETSIKSGVTKAKGVTGELAQAFKDMAVEPMAGAISGSRAIQGIEQALSKLPASADLIGKKYTALLDDMGSYVDNIVKGLSSVEGKEMVGAQIKQGADKFVNQFTQKATVLYDDVSRYIPRGDRFGATNLGTQLNKTVDDFANDPEFAEMLTSPLMKQLKEAYIASEKRGGMTFNTMKALRTKIGGMMKQPALLGDTSSAELKQLYGSLSDDMLVAASKSDKIRGDTKATHAMNRASSFWSAGRDRIDTMLNPVVNKKLTQDVFNAAMSGAKNGNQKLKAIKKSLPPAEWRSLVARQIKEMGTATPGAQNATQELFSPATFLTSYSKLSKEAQKTLFSGEGYEGLSKAMDNLVNTTAALKDTATMANNSGTAQQLIYMNMLTTGVGGGVGYSAGGDASSIAQGAVAAHALPYATARLMTSPKFINWLAKSADIVPTPNGIGAHLGRLAAIGTEDLELQPAIQAYLSNLRGTTNGTPEELAPAVPGQ
jgi:hypothetical protein